MNNNPLSKYRKVLLAVQRTKQLQNGARPRVNLVDAKPSRIAIAEIDLGLIGFQTQLDKPVKK